MVKIALPAQLKIWFWSVYGRFVWDEHTTEPPYLQQINSALRAQTSGSDPHVLDVVCGTGSYALGLARAGFDVTGIDAAPGMLARAYPKVASAPPGRLRFQPMNLDDRLAFPDHEFDAAIAVSVLQAVTDPVRTLQELWRVLKPGGVLVVVHVPKPAYHALPLREEVRQRAQYLQRKTARNIMLQAAKSWAERTGGTRYWTAAELHDMLEAQRYRIKAISSGPPILAVAHKPRT